MKRSGARTGPRIAPGYGTSPTISRSNARQTGGEAAIA